MIGFFDSGIGGLTIFDAVQKIAPHYDSIYLGDSAFAPYGDKNFEEIYHRTWLGVKYLLDEGCKLVIIACNTSSAQALRKIQQENLDAYPGKRVLGIIRPTVEFFGKSEIQSLGILSTEATKRSGAYEKELNKLKPDLHVLVHACPKFVPLIESGKANSAEMDAEVKKSMDAFLDLHSNIDVVLLGCTHYPVIYSQIRSYLPENIALYTQGDLVAASFQDYLFRHPEIEEKFSQNSKRRFLTTGSVNVAQDLEHIFSSQEKQFQYIDLP